MHGVVRDTGTVHARSHTSPCPGAGVAEQVVVAFLIVGLDRAKLLEPGATMSAGDEVCRAAPATAVLVVIHHACKQ